MRNWLLVLCTFFAVHYNFLHTCGAKEYLKHVAYALPLVGTAVVIGKEINDNESYRDGIEKKLVQLGYDQKLSGDIAKHSRIFLDSIHELFEKEKKEKSIFKTSPWFTALVQLLLITHNIPVKLGRTLVHTELSPEHPIKIYLFNKKITINNVTHTFASDIYSLIIEKELYNAIENAYNPLYCLKHTTVKFILLQHAEVDYFVEAEISTSLMRDIFWGVLLHESGHVKKMINHQEIVGTDVSLKESELQADAEVQNSPQGLIGIMAFLNMFKVSYIYTLKQFFAAVPEKDLCNDMSEYEKKINTEKAKAENVVYDENNFYPTFEERIGQLQPHIKTRGNRTITIRVFTRNLELHNGRELHRSIILKEENDFAIEL